MWDFNVLLSACYKAIKSINLQTAFFVFKLVVYNKRLWIMYKLYAMLSVTMEDRLL